MSMRYERTEWASPSNPSLQRGRVDQIVPSPNGSSEVVAGSEEYKYVLVQPGDSPHKKESRKRVMRQARSNAQDKFDADTVDVKKSKRREKVAVKGAEAARSQPQLAPMPAAMPAAPPPPPVQPAVASVGDTNRNTQLDWALLRAYRRIGNPAGVLEVLRIASLVPSAAQDDELWTPQRVTVRHRVLREAVRLVAQLVGDEHPNPLARMQELRSLCE